MEIDSMKNLYDKILAKPLAYRKKLAYFLTAFLGLFFFFIWLSKTIIAVRKTIDLTDEEKENVLKMKRVVPSLEKDADLKQMDSSFESLPNISGNESLSAESQTDEQTINQDLLEQEMLKNMNIEIDPVADDRNKNTTDNKKE